MHAQGDSTRLNLLQITLILTFKNQNYLEKVQMQNYLLLLLLKLILVCCYHSSNSPVFNSNSISKTKLYEIPRNITHTKDDMQLGGKFRQNVLVLDLDGTLYDDDCMIEQQIAQLQG